MDEESTRPAFLLLPQGSTMCVSCAAPLFKSPPGSSGDIGTVAVGEQNSLCLFFILNCNRLIEFELLQENTDVCC